ncbi:MAG: hypothetical protein WC943_00685 [Elusimicrobiota bacterium]
MAALAVLLFALPVAIVFYKHSAQTLISAVAEKRQKTAAYLANSAVTDYMRQFSQDAYNGHYDLSTLSRPETFTGAGFSSVDFEADSVNRTVFLRATGTYGSSARPLARKVLEALIQFASDLVQFGVMVNGGWSISSSNVTYFGGFYTNGNLSITGANVRFQGGPLVVAGNVAGNNAVVDGDLYYSGVSAANITVLGQTYNYIPAITWPTLDFAYYDAHYTYKTTVNRTIVFNSTNTFTVVGGATYGIPADGAIIYGENCSLTVRGVVSGRVTVVAGSAAAGNCASASGRVIVSDDLYYVGASSIAAGPNQSFAALARNCARFQKNAANLTAVGVYFVQEGTNNMELAGTAGFRFQLFGVRTQIVSPSGFAPNSYTYDPNLRSYPPPGLPEKALLVNWNLR